MRTASFFCISLALHAAALAYPALHNAPEKTPPLVVSLVEDEGGGGAGESSPPSSRPADGMKSESRKQLKRVSSQTATSRRTAESAVEEAPKTAELVAPTEPVALPVVETQAQSVIAVRVREGAVNVALENGAASFGDISPKVAGGSGSTAAGSGHGADSGSGAGSGSGGGVGDGTGNGAGRFVQASYMSCPKTEYPEAARRQGWEGTVTIEVAVDAEGRPKSSRVQQSSGFAVLDGAALDNIQRRCRFYPARRGETRVATSIRIPVVFRLADSR